MKDITDAIANADARDLFAALTDKNVEADLRDDVVFIEGYASLRHDGAQWIAKNFVDGEENVIDDDELGAELEEIIDWSTVSPECSGAPHGVSCGAPVTSSGDLCPYCSRHDRGANDYLDSLR